MDIGRRLLQAFKESGIVDKKVIAEKLGFKSSKAIYKVVSGAQELSFESLRRFRESTGHTIDWLLTGEEPATIGATRPLSTNGNNANGDCLCKDVFRELAQAVVSQNERLLDLITRKVSKH